MNDERRLSSQPLAGANAGSASLPNFEGMGDNQ